MQVRADGDVFANAERSERLHDLERTHHAARTDHVRCESGDRRRPEAGRGLYPAAQIRVIAANNVVLPAPFGPISATISPCATSSEAPSTAAIPPKRLPRSRTSSMRAVSRLLRGRRDEHACDAVRQEAQCDDQQRCRKEPDSVQAHCRSPASRLRRAHEAPPRRTGARRPIPKPADNADEQRLDRHCRSEGDVAVHEQVLLHVEDARRSPPCRPTA